MTDRPVSVVVVNYNSGPLLAACLRSLPGDLAECVVVDNDSRDGSADDIDQVRRDMPVTLLRNRRNLGFSAAVNRGARAAGGRIVVLLNPDCVLAPGAIESMVQALDVAHGPGLVGGLVVNPDGTEQRGCRRNEPTPRRILRRLWVGGKDGNGIDRTGEPLDPSGTDVDAVSGAFLALTRELFDEIGGMDEGYFLHFEDLDLCRRVRDAGRTVRFIPTALAVHAKSASGGTTQAVVEGHKNNGLMRYLDKFHPPGPAVRSLLRSALLLRGMVQRLRQPLRPPAVDQTAAAELGSLVDLLAPSRQDLLVVCGATSQVGDYLLPRARAAGFRILALTRGERAGRIGNQDIWWVHPDFLRALAVRENLPRHAWIHLAPIWILQQYAEPIGRLGPGRLVALGSSSIDTKKTSGSAREREVVTRLALGENIARSLGERLGIGVTVFRPTMIYGNRNNSNIAFLATLSRRLRFLPIVGDGQGRRQPVHAGDVASACLAVLDKPDTFDKIYYLGGGEVLEYREMLRRVLAQAGVAPRILSIPGAAARFALRIVSRVPGLTFLTPEMVDRMNDDLVFDCSPAREDFGYRPREFLA